MSAPTRLELRPAVRVSIAAVTGAILAYGVSNIVVSVKQQSTRSCESTDGMCFTWSDVAVLPICLIVTLIALSVVYKWLEIGPRLAIVPPTVLLAPIPLAAAQATGGWWAVTVVGGAWSCSLALAAWSRYRIPGLTAAAILLFASLVVLYR
ncbi:hypothetical protein [Streptomyces sp. NPDC002221]|uniref:hypothetical protein n=1 Tax=Streptomyces sp. NPDC002221 TaxID=3364639 RepID=UPI0036A6EF1A